MKHLVKFAASRGRDVRAPMSTEIWGHRGASAHAPENTIAAFKMAIEMGADGVELDIQLTKDNEIVVIHDESIDRICGRKGNVKDHSFTTALSFERQGSGKDRLVRNGKAEWAAMGAPDMGARTSRPRKATCV